MRRQAARAQACPAILIDVLAKAQGFLLLAREYLDDGEGVDIFRRDIRNLARRPGRLLGGSFDTLRIAKSDHEQRGYNGQRDQGIRRAKQ